MLGELPLSNFAGQGPAPVGKYQGMNPYGTYDLAGNVKHARVKTMLTSPPRRCGGRR